MEPAAFDYHRPTSLSEALDLLSSLEDARPLAGGQSLLPVMKMRLATPAALVDLRRIGELSGIRRDGDELVIGAMTRYAEVVRSREVSEGWAVLAECTGTIGDLQVRNVGTVGGSVAHADPAADLPTALVALDASVVATGKEGERAIPAREFFLGNFLTALEEGELVTAVRVPLPTVGTGTAYVKHPHPASRYAVVGVAALARLDDGRFEDTRVAVGGVTGIPEAIPAVAEELNGREFSPDAIARAAELVPGALENSVGDSYASGEYRAHLSGVLTRRALSLAAERAAG